MSTAILDLQKQMADELAQARQTVAAPSSNRVSLRGKKFTLPDGRQGETLDVVIVGHTTINQFYENSYTQGEYVPPVCFAHGRIVDALVPSEASPKVQHASCADCPMNAFGSRGKGKACKNGRRIAFVEPGSEGEGKVYTLDVPPSAISNYDGYINALAATGRVAIQAITQITFDANQSYPKPLFTAIGANEKLAESLEDRAYADPMLDRDPA